MIRLRHLSPVLALIALTACSAGTTPATSFPVESKVIDVEGTHITVPAEANLDRYESFAPVTANGRISGAVKYQDQLRAYVVRYSVYMTGKEFQPRMVIEVPKGKCNGGDPGCVPFVNEQVTVGETQVITQRWPDTDGSVLVVKMLQRGSRILKLTWNEQSGAEDSIAEAITKAAIVDMPKPGDSIGAGIQSPSSAPPAPSAPVSAPSSAG